MIGGLTAAEANTASGNIVAGLEVHDARVLGNRLGTDITGATAIPNGNSGSRQAGRRTSAAPRPVTAT